MSSQLLNKKLGHKNLPFVLHPLASSFRNWIPSRNFENCHFYGDWYLTKPPIKKELENSHFFNLQEGSNEMQKFYCWFPNKRTPPQLDSFTDFTLVNVTPRVMEVLQALLKFLVSTPAPSLLEKSRQVFYPFTTSLAADATDALGETNANPDERLLDTIVWRHSKTLGPPRASTHHAKSGGHSYCGK